MHFEDDDLDWAMGELLHLFLQAGVRGVPPHKLRPDIFHPAWCVLNAQPFEIRQHAHRVLMMQILRPWEPLPAVRWIKLDADAFIK